MSLLFTAIFELEYLGPYLVQDHKVLFYNSYIESMENYVEETLRQLVSIAGSSRSCSLNYDVIVGRYFAKAKVHS